jgi:hypothetical protein
MIASGEGGNTLEPRISDRSCDHVESLQRAGAFGDVEVHMTKDRDFKALVRQRMQDTGEPYTVARERLRPTGDGSTHTGEEAPTPSPEYLEARRVHQRLIRPYFDGRTLRSIPSRRKPRAAVVLELLSWFTPGRRYAEAEVNELLKAAHEDFAFLRRELVNYRYLERTTDGVYWTCEQAPDRDALVAQEITDWERVWLPAFIEGGARNAGQSSGT